MAPLKSIDLGGLSENPMRLILVLGVMLAVAGCHKSIKEAKAPAAEPAPVPAHAA